jgi:hypothetical protein
MERRLPHPLPSVRYIPEYEATGALHESYEDMKRVLQVPWMGVVTMAYAHFPQFFATFWNGVRELAGSEEFVAAARSLRSSIEDAVAELAPPPIAMRLAAHGYADRELDDIRAVAEMLSHGNYLYTLLTTAARYLLEGGELGAVAPVAPFRGSHAPPARVPLVLMEAHHVDVSTRAVFDDVKRALGLPFLNTDYRALARWPSYFALAWGDLRPQIARPAHEAICDLYQETATSLVAALPNPAGLTSAALRAAAERDASSELVPVVELFQHLHAGLMTNVAFFRHQLLHDER